MGSDIDALEKDLPFEKSEWPVLRIGWALMGMFLLAGILGFLGTGIFTEKKAATKDFVLHYDKYLRYSMSSEINLKTRGLGPDSSVFINSDYFRNVVMTEVNPEPATVDQSEGWMRFRFSSRTPTEITIHIQPIRSGKRNLKIRLDSSEVAVPQYIFF